MQFFQLNYAQPNKGSIFCNLFAYARYAELWQQQWSVQQASAMLSSRRHRSHYELLARFFAIYIRVHTHRGCIIFAPASAVIVNICLKCQSLVLKHIKVFPQFYFFVFRIFEMFFFFSKKVTTSDMNTFVYTRTYIVCVYAHSYE